MFINSKKKVAKKWSWRDGGSLVKSAHCTLAEDLSSVPSTHLSQLTIIYTPVPGHQIPSSGLLQAPYIHMVYIQTTGKHLNK